MATEAKLKGLLEWLDTNEIKWDKKDLEIRLSNSSFGVFALRDLTDRQPLVKIPKTAILSSKSTGIANILEDEHVDGGCSLALAVLYELSQGDESPWYGYLQALPFSEDLPVFWTEQEKAWLQGTEIDASVHNDLNDLKDDYEMIVKPLLEQHPYVFTDVEKNYSFDLFCRISTLVASRSFEVDAYHGTAMVPFADIFNHRAGSEHVHFETDYEVCEACGAPEYCEHRYLEALEMEEKEGESEDLGEDTDDEHENDDEEEEEEEDEAMSDAEEVMEDGDMEGMPQELKAMMEADQDSEEEEEDTSLADLEDLEERKVNFWEQDEEEQEKDTCDMVLDRPVKAQEEIFNTYGEHPNSVLLAKYGFCYENNAYDCISFSREKIFDACVRILQSESSLTEDQVKEQVQSRMDSLVLRHEEDGCCGGGDHEHGHGHSHGHGHGEEDEEEEEEDEEDVEDNDRPFFANKDGVFEDDLMILVYCVYCSQAAFNKVQEGGFTGMKDRRAERLVYTTCVQLATERRDEYPKTTEVNDAKNQRLAYALLCRHSEQDIVRKTIETYQELLEQSNILAQEQQKKNKKQKKTKGRR